MSDSSEEDGDGQENYTFEDDSEEESQFQAGHDDKTKEKEATPAKVKTKNKKSKKRKLKDGSSSKLPGGLRLTPKLVNQLTETEKLYQTNLYKFQIQELLQEISIGAKVKSEFETWFMEFQKFVGNLESSPSFDIGKSKAWLGKVKLPLPPKILPKKSAKGSFKFVKPEVISKIGSWASETQVYKLSALDIALQIPKECLNNSDTLNHKYHVKRAMYLTYLGIQLKKRGDDVHFVTPQGNPIKPSLEIYLNSSKTRKVRIHCIPPPDLFKASKLAPAKNNVRFEHLFQIPFPEDEIQHSTPNYNSTILRDMLMEETSEYVKEMLARNENFCDALKLLKVWLQQRSLNQGFGSFSNFIMTMFLCYLADKKKINNNMSSYQIIRVVFVSLIQTDWSTKGIRFSDSLTEEEMKEWEQRFDVVFLNPTNQLNFTSDLSKLTYRRVKTEAKLALDILNESKVTGFQSMFMTKVDFFLNFDHVLQIKVDEELTSRLQNETRYQGQFLNHSAFFYPIGITLISPLIEKCLKTRLQLLDVQLPAHSTWELESKPNSEIGVLRFGIVIDRELAAKLIEKNEAEGDVQEFKELWGERSVLRRFRDGSMLETVTFDNPEEKYRVCFSMLKYVLDTHLGIEVEEEGLDYLDDQVEKIYESQFEIIRPKGSDEDGAEPKKKKAKRARRDSRREEYSRISLDEITNMAAKSFDHLSKVLRELNAEGLPLAVTSVQGTSSVLRFTNFYPTPPQSFFSSKLLTEERGSSLAIRASEDRLPKYVEPIGVLVQLEGSGKWPDDLKAIERLKCAFLIRIGGLLVEQFGLCVQTHTRFLDVLKDGFVFRIKLTYYRELILLRQIRGEDGILRIRDNPKSLLMEKQTLLLPQLTSTLHSFGQGFGAFGKTCRLAKRFVASHLLLVGGSGSSSKDARFTEEAIELIIAHLFLEFAPHLTHANEAQVGFLRFLEFMSSVNFKSTSIILNFNEKLSKEDVEGIESEFVKRRDELPLLFIATPEDKLGSVWTKHLDPIILHRLSYLAGKALGISREQFSNLSGVDFETLFTPDTSHFSMLIWIKKEMNTRVTQSVATKAKLQFKEYNKRKGELIPIVDFDPVQKYLEELRTTFDHLCLFLHDHWGGEYIAVVWKPKVLEGIEFKVSTVKARQSGAQPKATVVNPENLSQLFQVMGKGIVDRVEIPCQKV